ncbi:hypothetical protein M7M4_23170 [Corynebacterium pseudogenitalium]
MHRESLLENNWSILTPVSDRNTGSSPLACIRYPHECPSPSQQQQNRPSTFELLPISWTEKSVANN